MAQEKQDRCEEGGGNDIAEEEESKKRMVWVVYGWIGDPEGGDTISSAIYSSMEGEECQLVDDCEHPSA